MAFEDAIYTRASHFSYEIKDNKLRIFPSPVTGSPTKMWVEFSVETALVPTGKRIQVKVASQTSLMEYFGDYEGAKDIKAGYCCFYITLHPSKLTMQHIEETYRVVERKIMEQEIIIP